MSFPTSVNAYPAWGFAQSVTVPAPSSILCYGKLEMEASEFPSREFHSVSWPLPEENVLRLENRIF